MSEILKVLNKKIVELKSEVVELGLTDDISSDVRANGAGRDKARPLIRKAFSDIAKAIEILERIPKRTDRIEKNSKKLASQIKELGLNPKDLPAEIGFAINGTYTKIGRDAEVDIKSLKDAISSLKQGSEV